MIAARVADKLNEDTDLSVDMVRGGFGELSVYIDGEKVIDTNRLWYPLPSSIINKVKMLLVQT